MGTRKSSRSRTRWKLAIGLCMLALVAGGCGPLGDDEDDPTATTESQSTIEAPTTEAATETSGTPETPLPDDIATPGNDGDAEGSTPVSPRQNIPRPDPTENSGEDDPESTPIPDEAASDAATPDDDDDSTFVPDVETSDDDRDEESTPEGSVSDGTSGATPSDESGADGAEPTPDEDAATPDTEAQEPEVVDSCEVEDPPAFAGETDAFIVTEDVNFRTGPGSDCDLIGEAGLAAEMELTVLSGPVVREDDPDEIVWVNVDVDGEEGWVALEFIEPVPQD